MNLLEFAISFGAGFGALVVSKAIAEPVATRLGRLLLRGLDARVQTLLPEIWDALDFEWLPQEHTRQGQNTYQWLVETCIPAKAQAKGLELDEVVVSAIANQVIKNFDLEKHLRKLEGNRDV